MILFFIPLRSGARFMDSIDAGIDTLKFGILLMSFLVALMVVHWLSQCRKPRNVPSPPIPKVLHHERHKIRH